MPVHSEKSRIRDALEQLAAAHAQSTDEIERAIRTLAEIIESDTPTGSSGRPSLSDSTHARADRETLSVVWKRRSCFLGNTLMFALFERLARSPDRYVAATDLLDDVWGGDREPSTIRGVIKRLRDRLRAAGMETVAEAIEGKVTGYYRLRRV